MMVLLLFILLAPPFFTITCHGMTLPRPLNGHNPVVFAAPQQRHAHFSWRLPLQRTEMDHKNSGSPRLLDALTRRKNRLGRLVTTQYRAQLRHGHDQLTTTSSPLWTFLGTVKTAQIRRRLLESWSLFWFQFGKVYRRRLTRTARRHLVGFLLVLGMLSCRHPLKQYSEAGAAAAATTRPSMGLLSRTTDLPQLTLPSSVDSFADEFSDVYENSALTTTTTISRGGIQLTKRLTTSGTVLVAAAGGMMLGRYLLDKSNESLTLTAKNPKSFGKPNEGSNNNEAVFNPSTKTQTKSAYAGKEDNTKYAADVMLVRKGFDKIRKMDSAEQTKLELAQSLLSKINGTVAKSYQTLLSESEEIMEAAMSVTALPAEQGSRRKEPNAADEKRKEQAARRKVETILAAEMDKKKMAMNGKQQERVQYSSQNWVEATQNRDDNDPVDVALPPPVEETEFGHWLNAMKEDDTVSDRSALGSASQRFSSSSSSSPTNKGGHSMDYNYADQEQLNKPKQSVISGNQSYEIEDDGIDAVEDSTWRIMEESPEEKANDFGRESVVSERNDAKSSQNTASLDVGEDGTAVVLNDAATSPEDDTALVERAFAKMGYGMPSMAMFSSSPSSFSPAAATDSEMDEEENETLVEMDQGMDLSTNALEEDVALAEKVDERVQTLEVGEDLRASNRGNVKAKKNRVPDFLTESKNQRSGAFREEDDLVADAEGQEKSAFSLFAWANRNAKSPMKQHEEEDELTQLADATPRPALGLRRSPKRVNSVADVNEDGYTSFEDAMDFQDPLEQPRSADEEDLLKRKYESIQDVGERAYQILLDLGMVGRSSQSDDEDDDQ